MAYIVVDRHGKKYTVTTRRVIAQRGLITKSMDEVLLAHIRSLNVRQDIRGRLFGYGDILIGTAGTDGVEVVMTGVHRPFRLKETITRAAQTISLKASSS